MKAPGVGVAVIVVRQGRVLVVRRARPPAEGMWTFPGGRVELGETLRQAAVRELREECGLEVILGELVDVVEVIEAQAEETYHWVLVIYGARPAGGALRPGDDALEARWVTLDQLAVLPAPPRVRRLAARMLGQATAGTSSAGPAGELHNTDWT